MLNKFNTKTLIVILAVLAAGALFVFMSDSGAPKSSMPQYLMQFDVASATSITIDPKEEEPYTIEKVEGAWKLVLDNGKKVPIVESRLEAILATLSELKPEKLVSRNVEKHAEFEVGTENGVPVKVVAGDQTIELVVGKFTFSQPPGGMQQQQMQQQQPKIGSYVRLANQDEVYKIEGSLSWEANKKRVEWRDNDLIKPSKYDLSKIEVKGETEFSMEKDSTDHWAVTGIDLDSTGVAKYLDALMALESKDFNDEVSSAGMAKMDIYLTTKEGENTHIAIDQNLVVSSSDLPESFFNLSPESFEKLIPANTSMESLEEGVKP